MIQTLSEQEATAKAGQKIYTCLSYKRGDTPHNGTWFVAFETDSSHEAEQWFNKQPKMARVWRRNGQLYFAK